MTARDLSGPLDRSRIPGLLAIGLTLLGTLALLWPAFDNGFPLVYQDTAWYLGPLINAGQHPLRTIGYTLFAAVAMTIPSLWSVVTLQAFVTSALLTRVAWVVAERPVDRPRVAALSMLSVLLLSGAAKYTSWLMADITASWIYLAGALWLLSTTRWDRAIAFGLGGLAVLAHNSHLPLALATSVGIAGVSLWRAARVERRAVLGLLAATLLFVPGVWIANSLTGERGEVLRGTDELLLYSMSDSGVLLDTLDAWCDDRDWRMCAYRSQLAEHVGEKKGWLLFDPASPFYQVGGYESAETRELVLHGLLCCTPQLLRTTLEEAWIQFWEIDSHDGLLAEDTNPALQLLQNMGRPKSAALLEEMSAGWGRFSTATAQRELQQLWGSRQRRAGDARVLLHPLPESGLQAALLVVGIGMAAFALRRGNARPAYWVGSMILFLTANAGICAFGSSVNGRYQGRISWLLAFMLVVAGYSALRAHLDAGQRQPPR